MNEQAPAVVVASASPARESRRAIVFVNRFFHPDHSATSQILSDLAFDLAARGERVTVIASRGTYDDPSADLPAVETIENVAIHRVFRPRFGRGALAGRAVDTARMHASFAFAAARIARRGDILVAKTDPPMLGVTLAAVAGIRGLRLINWLQDLYPEVALELGLNVLRPVSPLLTALRDAGLRSAAANVAIGELMAERIARSGAQRDRIHVIPNWCDDAAIDPALYAGNRLRAEWGLEGKFVVGYSGNLGRAHEYETLLGAAERLRDRRDIVFLFIGGGHLSGQLEAAVDARGLGAQFQFRPYQGAAMLPVSLTLPDVHWLSLVPAMEGLIVPSKFYGIAAAGRPTIAVTAPDGEIARLVQRYECGAQTNPGDPAPLAETIAKLAAMPERVAKLGANARRTLKDHFTQNSAFALWRALVDQHR